MRPCRIVLRVLIVAYALALALFLIGTFGWFGSPSGPLAGVYLVPLGVPWIFLLDRIPGLPGGWIAIGAPVVNIVIVGLFCRALGRGRTKA